VLSRFGEQGRGEQRRTGHGVSGDCRSVSVP
jgi:hypothetical protein